MGEAELLAESWQLASWQLAVWFQLSVQLEIGIENGSWQLNCQLKLNCQLPTGKMPTFSSMSPFTSAFLLEQLPAWPESARTLLQEALAPAGGGRIDPQTVKQLIAIAGSTDALMKALLPIVKKYSRPPISGFEVGVVALGQSGALYAGANCEVPRSGLNQAIHGEQSAIANAFGHGETGIVALAVSAAPCGHCRQFLNELAGGDDIRVLAPPNQAWTVKELLPSSFGPKDLDQTEAIFTSRPHTLGLPASSDPVAAKALEAAIRSYAPYSKSPSGCAIQMTSGAIYGGSYLENAAFNPSLAPLQSALVAVVMHQEQFEDITEVALVESPNATISHATATRSILAVLAPRAQLTIVTAV